MDHKNLDVWKRSMDLVVIVYDITKLFPESERYGLTSQIRRSVVSIPSNIAEGSARKGDKELLQFINISVGSLAEVETQYLIALRLNFIAQNIFLEEHIEEVKKLLLGFKKYINSKIIN
jgi:four helix bundle protein